MDAPALVLGQHQSDVKRSGRTGVSCRMRRQERRWDKQTASRLEITARIVASRAGGLFIPKVRLFTTHLPELCLLHIQPVPWSGYSRNPAVKINRSERPPMSPAFGALKGVR